MTGRRVKDAQLREFWDIAVYNYEVEGIQIPEPKQQGIMCDFEKHIPLRRLDDSIGGKLIEEPKAS